MQEGLTSAPKECTWTYCLTTRSYPIIPGDTHCPVTQSSFINAAGTTNLWVISNNLDPIVQLTAFIASWKDYYFQTTTLVFDFISIQIMTA